MFTTSGQDRPSPQDWLPASAITYLEDTGKLVIDLTKLNVPLSLPPKVFYPGIVSRSLDPVVDIKGNLVYIAGRSLADHQRLIDALIVGDIVAYRFPADNTKPATAYISHRIVQIGTDNLGKFFKFKGDNNSLNDPFTVREENLKWINIIVVD